ncbi:hypothetical protein [Brevundimonas sp.]|uniref:hypothetical protein n=1 Tax=Brevundimonas sp. TaxID=1871086 RepID=UPI0035B33921
MTGDQPTPGCPAGWYVAFFDGDRPKWWWRLCRPGFRHVCAFGFAAEECVWLVYDVTLKRTFVHALSPVAFDRWYAALPAHRTVLHYLPEKADPPAWRFGFWCTIAVAHLLALRTRALRPQALYADLIAHGARPAFESEAA